MAMARAAANAEIAQLKASGDPRLVELLEASQAGGGADVLKRLRKPPGTIAIVAEGVPIRRRTMTELGAGTGRSGWLDDDLADATWLSEQFRLGGAAAVCASARLSVNAVADTAREQQSACGSFPGPAPVIARGCFLHPLQLAKAALDGAQAAILPLELAGSESTRVLQQCAHGLGLGTLVRVTGSAGLEAARQMGAAAVVIGDVSLEEAEALRALLPPEALSVCDVRLQDIRDVWRARDSGFHALVVGEFLLRACARDNVEPAPLIKAMLAKGSVEFGGGAGKVLSGGASAYGPSLPKSMPTFKPINKI